MFQLLCRLAVCRQQCVIFPWMLVLKTPHSNNKNKRAARDDEEEQAPKAGHSNPMCTNPTHKRQKLNKPTQRHICRECAQEDFDAIKTIPHLTQWDTVCLMNLFNRAYFCGICLLEEPHSSYVNGKKHVVSAASHCKRHSVYNAQHICFRHKKPWSRCHDCLHEYRSGTLKCHLCAHDYTSRCICPRGPIALRQTLLKEFTAPQPAAQVALKQTLADNTLAYAKALQAAQGDNARIWSIVSSRPTPAERPKSVFELRSAKAAKLYRSRAS